MTRIAVVKTRRMIAAEIQHATGGEAWERDVLARLSAATLRRVAGRLVHDFENVVYETLES